MSRSWNLTQSALASTARSTSCLARSTLPWWLLPISAITKVGWSLPTRWLPTVKESLVGEAIATMRPRASSTGTRLTPSRNFQSSSSTKVPSVTVRGERLATLIALVSMLELPAVSQRRTSPSVSEPCSTPCSSTRKIVRALLALILARVLSKESSAKAT